MQPTGARFPKPVVVAPVGVRAPGLGPSALSFTGGVHMWMAPAGKGFVAG